MKLINLEAGNPTVHEALIRMAGELATARRDGHKMLKLIHGYGSSGAGGDIRITVQKRLYEMAQNGEIRACIFGENWSKSDAVTWKVLMTQPELKQDADLGRSNRGITIVLL